MGLPPAFWRRASLSSETRPAKSGVLALVPPIAATCPPMTMLKPSPSAATSGLPRPAVLTAAAGGKGSSCEAVFR